MEVVGAQAVCARQGHLEALATAGLQNARVASVVPPVANCLSCNLTFEEQLDTGGPQVPSHLLC